MPVPNAQIRRHLHPGARRHHRLVECSNAAAITVTVPSVAAITFPIGARIEIAQIGAGQITVAGSGVILRLPAGKTAKTRSQYAIIGWMSAARRRSCPLLALNRVIPL
jgi:hypothetical protein